MTGLLPRINAAQYILRVPHKGVRYHRQGRFIWALTTFENKDYVTLGAETIATVKKEALYYGRWHLVEKWIKPDEVEPY